MQFNRSVFDCAHNNQTLQGVNLFLMENISFSLLFRGFPVTFDPAIQMAVQRR